MDGLDVGIGHLGTVADEGLGGEDSAWGGRAVNRKLPFPEPV